jgi:AraC family transcriptional regulator
VTAANYDARLDRITAHMEERLDDPLDLELLPEIAELPPAHWHRLYHARRGETALMTFSRLRLERAAEQLAQTAMSVDEVAAQCGYRRLEAFNRAFERACGISPTRFRRQGGDCRIAPPPPLQSRRCPVVVDRRPSWYAVTIVHRGGFADIGRSFDALHGWLMARGRGVTPLRSIGVMYDDPLLVAEADLESRAGVVLAEDVEAEWPLERVTLSGRDYAVATYTGPLAQLRQAYQWLYGEWLPASGRWLADEPVIEEYVSDPRGLSTGDIDIRIALPLV